MMAICKVSLSNALATPIKTVFDFSEFYWLFGLNKLLLRYK